MSNFGGLYNIRDYTADDRSFILATFLRGLYYGDFFFDEIPKQVFMENYKVVASKLIDSKNVIIKVACLPDDPNVILGYSMLSSDFSTAHWLFVKQVWRRKGIGKSLLPQRLTQVSHLSKLGKSLLTDKYKDTIFNPFSIS